MSEMKQIKGLIDNVFGDTSVSAETTAGRMKEIKAACDEMLDALRDDGVDVSAAYMTEEMD